MVTQDLWVIWHGMTLGNCDYAEKLKQSRFVSLMLRHNKAEFLICTLEHNRLLQQPLELNFSQGEHVSFYLSGSGTSVSRLCRSGKYCMLYNKVFNS